MPLAQELDNSSCPLHDPPFSSRVAGYFIGVSQILAEILDLPASPWSPSSPLTIQLVVHNFLQMVQPLQNRLPVQEGAHLGVPAPQPSVRTPDYLHQLLGAILDPAVD